MRKRQALDLSSLLTVNTHTEPRRSASPFELYEELDRNDFYDSNPVLYLIHSYF